MISGLTTTIFASTIIKIASKATEFESDTIISVLEKIFFAPDLIISGRKKTHSWPDTINLLAAEKNV